VARYAAATRLASLLGSPDFIVRTFRRDDFLPLLLLGQLAMCVARIAASPASKKKEARSWHEPELH